MFRSNNCIAINLQDIGAAENFYTNVMKFELLNRTSSSLEYDTGHFLPHVNKNANQTPPIPSFCVPDIAIAKKTLLQNGCAVLHEGRNSLHFGDPFGIIYDVVQDVSFTPQQQQTKSE